MQAGHTQLTSEQCQRSINEGQCISFAQLGYYLINCFICKTHRTPQSQLTKWQFSLVMLMTASCSSSHQVLINSGTHANFMDYSQESYFMLRLEPLESTALDGRLL